MGDNKKRILNVEMRSIIMERWEKLTGKRAQKIGGGYPELKDA